MSISIFDEIKIKDGKLKMEIEFSGIKNPEKFREFMSLEMGGLGEKLVKVGLVSNVTTKVKSKINSEPQKEEHKQKEKENKKSREKDSEYKKVILENIDKIIIIENYQDYMKMYEREFIDLLENDGILFLDMFEVKNNFKNLKKGDKISIYSMDGEIFLISKIEENYLTSKPFMISKLALDYVLDIENKEEEEQKEEEFRIKDIIEDLGNLLSAIDFLKKI